MLYFLLAIALIGGLLVFGAIRVRESMSDCHWCDGDGTTFGMTCPVCDGSGMRENP